MDSGYRLRAAEPSDLQAVSALLATVQQHLRGESELNQNELLSFWQRPGFNLETDAWVVVAAQENEGISLVGYEDIAFKPGYAHLRGDGCVHPAYRNLGIGTQLIRRLHGRALELAALAPSTTPVILNNILNASDSVGRSLLENEGFQLVRNFYRMEINLKTPPEEPVLPDGLELRYYQPGQEHSLFKTIEAAFQDHWGYAASDFEAFKHDNFNQINFDPGLILSVWSGETMVGCALCQMRDKRGWVRQLAVLRPWRHKGLGKALLQRAFRAFFLRGQVKVALGVDASSETGATRLYEKAGMVVVNHNLIFEKLVREALHLG
jgi:mycothiol synthase